MLIPCDTTFKQTSFFIIELGGFSDHGHGSHLWDAPSFGVGVGSMNIITDWWFGTFFIFPNSWDDDPI